MFYIVKHLSQGFEERKSLHKMPETPIVWYTIPNLFNVRFKHFILKMTNKNSPPVPTRFGIISIILMFVPVLFIFLLSFILEPFVGNLPNTIQRLLAVVTLLLPAVLGFIFAIVGLARRERRKWIHIIAMIINLLESLYFGFLVSFAG